MVGRVRVRGRDEYSNLIPVPVPDFWLSEKTRTRTHTRSTRILPVKIGTDLSEYLRIRIFLPYLYKTEIYDRFQKTYLIKFPAVGHYVGKMSVTISGDFKQSSETLDLPVILKPTLP